MRPLLVLLLVAAPATAADLLPFKSQAERWVARFPAQPTPDSKELAIGGSRSVPLVMHSAKDPKSQAVFSITVAEYPPAFAEVPAATLLDGVRDGLKGKDGKVTAEKPLKGPHPGRAVRIEAGRNTVRSRLVLVGTRLYQVTVAGSTRSFPDELSEEFFASFEPRD